MKCMLRGVSGLPRFVLLPPGLAVLSHGTTGMFTRRKVPLCRSTEAAKYSTERTAKKKTSHSLIISAAKTAMPRYFASVTHPAVQRIQLTSHMVVGVSPSRGA